MPDWRRPWFDWDEGNIDHLLSRHDVFPEEAEAVFHNGAHVRRRGEVYEALGRDDSRRYLFVVCIERGPMIRIISARDMTDGERRRYERHS